MRDEAGVHRRDAHKDARARGYGVYNVFGLKAREHAGPHLIQQGAQHTEPQPVDMEEGEGER